VEITLQPAPYRRSGTASDQTEATRVSVRDNGAGLPTDHKQGFGMIGMHERVLALGGTMTVASTGQGVTIEAFIPNGTR
jgi:two-component system sensor histidine kinase UhpB